MRKDFYDSLEVDKPDLREGALFGRLPNLIALALSGAGWARHLGSVDPNRSSPSKASQSIRRDFVCRGARNRRKS